MKRTSCRAFLWTALVAEHKPKSESRGQSHRCHSFLSILPFFFCCFRFVFVRLFRFSLIVKSVWLPCAPPPFHCAAVAVAAAPRAHTGNVYINLLYIFGCSTSSMPPLTPPHRPSDPHPARIVQFHEMNTLDSRFYLIRSCVRHVTHAIWMFRVEVAAAGNAKPQTHTFFHVAIIINSSVVTKIGCS